MNQLTLTDIWVYPIKSLGGIQLRHSRILGKGLPLDRRWMLIDGSGRFLSQREHPQMALFRLAINGDRLRVSFQGEGNASIDFDINATTGSPAFRAVIWDDEVSVLEVDKAISDWFSNCLQAPVKLVHFPETHSRKVDSDFSINDEDVSLADAFPYLIIGESSLADLNSRLETPVPMNRFRPNFIFSGGVPFEEDTWKVFSIGKSTFAGVKPCGRCTVTTVNQATAERGAEPLFTLSQYRKKNNKVLFGQNLVALDAQSVSVGDQIFVVEKKTQ